MIRHKLIEYDVLLLDKFIDILQDLHCEDLKEMTDATTSKYSEARYG
ncbi:putative phosphoenolpyruvate carboxylase [Helianthus debilis subsp. tardiflorus]